MISCPAANGIRAEAVDLCPAHEAYVHITALQVEGEDIVHAAHRQRPADQRWVADGQRQPGRLCPNHARLVDHQQVRRMRPPRQVARQVRQPHPDEHGVPIAQQTGSIYS